MASEINLQIVSPDGVIFEGIADELLVPTPKGQIGILPHHVNLYSNLSEGEIIIKKGGKEKFIAILGGFLEVGVDKVTIVTDYAVEAESIQVAHAKEAKQRAETALKEQKSKVDFIIADRDLKRSILELKVADRIKRRNPNI